MIVFGNCSLLLQDLCSGITLCTPAGLPSCSKNLGLRLLRSLETKLEWDSNSWPCACAVNRRLYPGFFFFGECTMRAVLVSVELSISTYVVKRLKMGLLLEMNGYDFEIGFTHWRSRFVFLVHSVEKYSFRVGTESVLKAVGSRCFSQSIVGPRSSGEGDWSDWYVVYVHTTCVIIENEALALCPPPLAKTLISTVWFRVTSKATYHINIRS